MMRNPKIGEECKHTDGGIGCAKVKSIRPDGLIEVYWSSNWDFNVGLIKVFKRSNLVRRVTK